MNDIMFPSRQLANCFRRAKEKKAKKDETILEVGIKLGYSKFWFDEFYHNWEYWFEEEELIKALDYTIGLWLEYESLHNDR